MVTDAVIVPSEEVITTGVMQQFDAIGAVTVNVTLVPVVVAAVTEGVHTAVPDLTPRWVSTAVAAVIPVAAVLPGAVAVRAPS